jgi:hypothetical protein
MENNELQHHGVKGMKWGVRKSRYVTVKQARNNARKREYDAKKQALQESKGKGMTVRRAIKNVNKVGQEARRQSIRDDKAYNKQLRAERKGKNAVEILLGKKGPVIDGDGWRPKKSEKQKRYEDDHGINPNRPNGTKNGKSPSEIVANAKLGTLDKNTVVKVGKSVLSKLLDPDTATKRD